jgi:crotonobetainyl-CoA:carnitine CoA-transferase CaiB-like acyl-CoA transferase
MPPAATDACPDPDLAAAYARALLGDLGHGALPQVASHPRSPAAGWAESGLMALTGTTAPRVCPLPLTAAAEGVWAALAALVATPLPAIDPLALLSERAAHLDLRRQGRRSPGGACRLLDTADGRLALNLAREDDWDLLPAWLEAEVGADWDALAEALRDRRTETLVERGRTLGLAVAAEAWPTPAPWHRLLAGRPWTSANEQPDRAPRVLDLSALWAGPLCGQLLRQLGAEVVKLESLTRPDGARRGPAAFFDRLNHGKHMVALDVGSDAGRRALRALIDAADIVIEASRPRALAQLGIDAEALVQARPGLSWISLTAHGREGADAEAIGYGDDASVAAGLSAVMTAVGGEPCFVGDALADPLTGLHATLAAWASWQQGGSRLLSLSLVDVLRHAVTRTASVEAAELRERARSWQAEIATLGLSIAPPAVPPPTPPAGDLGADTAAVLRDWAVSAC